MSTINIHLSEQTRTPIQSVLDMGTVNYFCLSRSDIELLNTTQKVKIWIKNKAGSYTTYQSELISFLSDIRFQHFKKDRTLLVFDYKNVQVEEEVQKDFNFKQEGYQFS